MTFPTSNRRVLAAWVLFSDSPHDQCVTYMLPLSCPFPPLGGASFVAVVWRFHEISR